MYPKPRFVAPAKCENGIVVCNLSGTIQFPEDFPLVAQLQADCVINRNKRAMSGSPYQVVPILIKDQSLSKPSPSSLEMVELPEFGSMKKTNSHLTYTDSRSGHSTSVDTRFLPPLREQQVDNTGQVCFAYRKTRSTTCIDPRGMPKDWEQRVSMDGGTYWYYTVAEKSTFIDPRGLPRGWMQIITQSSEVYFANNDTRLTAWEDPRREVKVTEETRENWRAVELFEWTREMLNEEKRMFKWFNECAVRATQRGRYIIETISYE